MCHGAGKRRKRAERPRPSSPHASQEARVLHAAVYIAGIVYVRTAVFFVGMAAELPILLQIFQ